MSPIDSATDLKLSTGTIAVDGGERTDEQGFADFTQSLSVL